MWRAKEILSGRFGTSPFDAELYEAFGALVLRMGDTDQAGRFLFLSGKRRPEYQSAIDLFLRKHARAGRGGLFAAFPAQVRRRPASELPPQVQRELEALKFAVPGDRDVVWAKLRPERSPSSTTGCVSALVIIGIGLVLSFDRGAFLLLTVSVKLSDRLTFSHIPRGFPGYRRLRFCAARLLMTA